MFLVNGIITTYKACFLAPVFSGVRVTRSLVLYVCLLIVVCPFVFFYLTIVLSGLPRYTDSRQHIVIKMNDNIYTWTVQWQGQ
jgi:hypothetical protein